MQFKMAPTIEPFYELNILSASIFSIYWSCFKNRVKYFVVMVLRLYKSHDLQVHFNTIEMKPSSSRRKWTTYAFGVALFILQLN